MDLYQYNTAEYRRHYKALIQRWDSLNHDDVCEPRVKELCELVHASNQGVSVYSCEGHADDWSKNQGYVMFAARNRDASVQLLGALQIAMAKAHKEWGSDGIGSIETNIATWGDDVVYPRVVIRSPVFTETNLADQWWALITRSVYQHFKPYILVSPVKNKVTFEKVAA